MEKQWYAAEYITGIKRYWYAANMLEACSLAHCNSTAVTCVRLASSEDLKIILSKIEVIKI